MSVHAAALLFFVVIYYKKNIEFNRSIFSWRFLEEKVPDYYYYTNFSFFFLLVGRFSSFKTMHYSLRLTFQTAVGHQNFKTTH